MNNSIDDYIDVVVISALKEEIDALTDTLTNQVRSINWERKNKKISEYFSCQIGEITLRDKKLRIAAAHASNKMGLTEATMITMRAFLACNPKLLVLIGICAGRYKENAQNHEKVDIGDIILPNTATHYYFGKITEFKVKQSENEQQINQDYNDNQQEEIEQEVKEEFKPEPKYANVNSGLFKDLIDALKNETALAQIPSLYPTRTGKPNNRLKAHDGLIGSSDLVIAAASKFQKAVEANRKLIAVDMESYAVLRVAEELGKKAVVIKSVSDYGDKRKGQNDSEQYREYAYFTAAAAFYKFVEYLAEKTNFFFELDDEQDVPKLLRTIRSRADSHLEALQPQNLDRINRKSEEQYFQKINNALKGDKKKIIAIVGDAGYGKTTLLGKIYEDRQYLSADWVALVRCDNLIIDFQKTLNKEAIDAVIGKESCEKNSFINVASNLKSWGTGLLLIDTLDLIIGKDFVKGFREFLSELLEQKVTVVFTCRKQEFEDNFIPFSYKLSGLSDKINNLEVKGFDEDEIKEAVSTYVKREEIEVPGGVERFVNVILSLKAVNTRLNDITSKPLLLGLICQIFARQGNIEEDLTVSKLYKLYWKLKIDRSRSYDTNSPELGAKSKICLEIAEGLYKSSILVNRLVDITSKNKLNLEQARLGAYSDLKSDQILTETNSMIGFFHQTFLEFAIAFWLKEQDFNILEEFFERVFNTNQKAYQAFLLPTVRQLFSIAENYWLDIAFKKFIRFIRLLGVEKIRIFKEVIFGITSRDKLDNQYLDVLANIALDSDFDHQKSLFEAIDYAPIELRDQLIDKALEILPRIELRLLDEAIDIIGRKIKMIKNLSIASYIDRSFQIIDSITQKNQPPEKQDKRRVLLGRFINSCKSRLESKTDKAELSHLRQYFFELGDDAMIIVFNLHLLEDVSILEQIEFFKLIIGSSNLALGKRQRRAINNNREQTILLLTKVLPKIVGDSDSCIYKTWLEALHEQQLPEVWGVSMSLAIGRIVATQQESLSLIVKDLIYGKDIHNKRNKDAIKEASGKGASNLIIQELKSLSRDDLIKRQKHLKPIISELEKNQNNCEIIKEIKDRLDLIFNEQQVNEEELQPRHQILQNINSSPRKKRKEIINSLTNSAQTGNEEALSNLIEISANNINEVSSWASKSLKILVADQQKFIEKGKVIIQKLLPVLSKKSEISVRANAIYIIKTLMQKSNNSFDYHLLKQIYQAIIRISNTEQNPEVLKALFELLEMYIRNKKQLSKFIFVKIIEKIESLYGDNHSSLTSDISEKVLIIFKTIARKTSENRNQYIIQLRRRTQFFLREVNLRQVPSGYMLTKDILKELLSFSFQREEFLKLLINDINDVNDEFENNLHVIADTIIEVEGKDSTLVPKITQTDEYSEKVKRVFNNRLVRR